jgi:hypothetical protein
MENHGAAGTPITAMPNLRGVMAQLLGKSSGTAFTVGAIVGVAAVLGIVLWKIGRRGAVSRCVFAAASVTCILVGYHAVIHDLTVVLPVVLMLFSAPAATRSEMRMDLALLILVYTSFFLGAWVWPWLNPWWWIPVVIWISKKYRNRNAVAATA